MSDLSTALIWVTVIVCCTYLFDQWKKDKYD